jgi:alkanesulfonate monooxygenase SsuD/methylene tetrahydromethanopterin reductase-like flavin-dependent oxidoreductase (luciferase family)
MKAEFAALGIPFAERGARTDAALRAIRSRWAEEDGIRARPAGAPGHAIPLLVGGNSPPAVRRAAALGDGWQPLNVTPAELSARLPAYRDACGDAARVPGRISVRLPPAALRGDVRADLEAYGEVGADEVVVSLSEEGGPAEVLRRWTGFAARAGLS